jgi:monothiol glutaredoxin
MSVLRFQTRLNPRCPERCASARPTGGVGPSATRRLAPLPSDRTRSTWSTGSAGVRGTVVARALPPEFKASIDEFVTSNKIVVFMKGNKEMPQCGFSNTVVQILNQLSVPFVTVDILENEMLRAGMKEYSCWPTFPQVYVDGEFYGGCDIMIEGFQNGELAETLEIALNS